GADARRQGGGWARARAGRGGRGGFDVRTSDGAEAGQEVVTAVWLRARSELRSRLPAVVALAVIVGVIGGVVIAAAAGARRTDSAYPRLLQASNALDVVADVSARDAAVGRRLQVAIERLPQVSA